MSQEVSGLNLLRNCRGLWHQRHGAAVHHIPFLFLYVCKK